MPLIVNICYSALGIAARPAGRQGYLAMFLHCTSQRDAAPLKRYLQDDFLNYVVKQNAASRKYFARSFSPLILMYFYRSAYTLV